MSRAEHDWVRALCGAGAEHDEAVAELHALLVRVARTEVLKRVGLLQVSGSELDGMAHQAAADALSAVIGRLDTFRGQSPFAEWACAFVVVEVASTIGRRHLEEVAQ